MTKHVELDFHFVHEKLQQRLFQLLSVSTSPQLVDMFTKPLDLSMFKNNTSKLMISSIYP